MTQKSTPLNKQLCFALYSANNAMGRLYRPVLKDLGLTYPQYLVLLALWETDRRKVGDLGQALGLESNTLTPLLKRMQGAGLITRNRDPEDERSVIIELTPEGCALEDKALTLGHCITAAVGRDADDIAHLRDQISQLTQQLLQASLPN